MWCQFTDLVARFTAFLYIKSFFVADGFAVSLSCKGAISFRVTLPLNCDLGGEGGLRKKLSFPSQY